MHQNAHTARTKNAAVENANIGGLECIKMHLCTMRHKCVKILHVAYAPRHECTNMKRTLRMHYNALKCIMSKMQQVRECIEMHTPRERRMQQ